MPNEFYSEYQSIKEDVLSNPKLFFEKQEIIVKGKKFIIFRFNFNRKIVQHAYAIADKKSKKVNNSDQAGDPRTNKQSLVSCFRGVLAEIGAQLYLELMMASQTNYKVERWDLEREEWEYESSEYDVRVVLPNGFVIKCESRSSMSYKTTLPEFCEYRHVITRYTTTVKLKEGENHLYFRPVYQYDDSIIQKNKLRFDRLINAKLSNPKVIEEYNNNTDKIRDDVTNDFRKEVLTSFFKDIRENKVHLYYVSGANLKDIELHAEKSRNAQKKSRYIQPPIIKCGDTMAFHKKIAELVNESSKINQSLIQDSI